MPGLKNRCRGWNQMPKALQRGEAGTRCRRRCGRDRRHSGGFLLRAMPPSCILSPPTSAILQAGHSSLTQRILESDAELCRGGDCRHSGGFLLRIMPPSWHPVPACVRYGILQAKPFSIAAPENRIGRGPRCRYGHCRRAIPHCSSENAASILKSGLEIKNRCT